MDTIIPDVETLNARRHSPAALFSVVCPSQRTSEGMLRFRLRPPTAVLSVLARDTLRRPLEQPPNHCKIPSTENKPTTNVTCYSSGARFIDKAREIDPYFPDYRQYIADRHRTGKSTSRKSYFYDILLSFDDEARIRLLHGILKEAEPCAGDKVKEIRGLLHGAALAPSATVHSSTWNAERLNDYLQEIDNCIAASNYDRAVSLSYTCLEGFYKAFIKEILPDKSSLTELLEMSREIKKYLAGAITSYPDEALSMIQSHIPSVDRARTSSASHTARTRQEGG